MVSDVAKIFKYVHQFFDLNVTCDEFFLVQGILKIDPTQNFFNNILKLNFENYLKSNVWSIGILILQMYSKKEYEYILKFKEKMLLKMKENKEELIHYIFLICDGCLKEDEKERISYDDLISRLRILSLFQQEKVEFKTKIIGLLDNSINSLNYESIF